MRSLQHMTVGIQQLKKLSTDVQSVYVLRIGFGNEIGQDRARRLLQLAIELRGNFMSQESPEGEVRRRQKHANDSAKEHHHPEAQ